MSASTWGALVPAVVAVLGAAAAWLRASAAQKQAAAAHKRLDNLPPVTTDQKQAS